MAAHIAFIVVVVSFGWFVLLALCLLAMWHLLTRKKVEKKTEEEEAGVIRRDEHVRVKEDIVKGPDGREAKAISIEKDDRFEKDIKKNEKDDMYCVDIEKGASSASK